MAAGRGNVRCREFTADVESADEWLTEADRLEELGVYAQQAESDAQAEEGEAV